MNTDNRVLFHNNCRGYVLKSTAVIYEADFGVEFGWTPYPGDYRSGKRIEQESGKTG
jgi:hypothetical protein